MKTAQKMKTIPVLFMLWALPLATLPRVRAQVSKTLVTQKEEAQLKLSATENYGKLPLSFEPNVGQSKEEVKFLSRGKGYTLFLTPAEAVLSLRRDKKQSALRMQLVDADTNATLHGQDELQGKVNYMIGNDRSRWNTGIPTFKKVHYTDVWPSIDMVWYGTHNELEYDFVIKPKGDVSRVKLSFAGADKLSLDVNGNLVVTVNGEEVLHKAPVIYQESATIPGRYILKSKHEVGFEVGTYDTSKPLVIDPVLLYSSYIGGDGSDLAASVAVDGSGQAYIAGTTSSSARSFPLLNAFEDSEFEDPIGFITKLNATGTAIIYSTFFGDDPDFCTQGICSTEIRAIAVTSDGRAAVTGVTNNLDSQSQLPVTSNAFQKNGFCPGPCGFVPNRAGDAFVSFFSADGATLIYSSFFGGAVTLNAGNLAFDAGNAIAIDNATHIYIAGQTSSNNLPTKHAFQWSRHSEFNGNDAFIAVFDPFAPNGNDTLRYASFYGGDGDDIGKGIAVDADRNAYIVGSTASTDLETKSAIGGPLQSFFQGGGFDGFVAKIDTEADGNASLTYSTYFGGNINDRVESVAVDAFQRAYITGASNSSPTSFPLINAFDSSQTNGEAFVAKLNADGTSLFYCSFLGGNNANTSNDGEEGLGIVLDFGGNAYVTGRTTSGASFPSVLPLASNQQGTAFLAKIEATISTTTAAKLLYSTTFGGSGAKGKAIAIDPKGNVYLGGTTGGNLTTTVGAFDTFFNGGGTDGFVAKFNSTFNDTIGVFRPSTNQFQLRDSNTTGNPDRVITLGQSGDQPIVGDWNGSGTDKPGVFRPSTGQFIMLIDKVTTITVNFGQPGDLAVAGDWDGNGIDTPGVFTPATGTWKLSNGFKNQNINNSTAPVSVTFLFGQAGDTPIAGDWDGDGKDSVGLYGDANSTFLLSNTFKGSIDFTPVIFGNPDTRPIAGDWNGDGIDTIGVFNQVTAVMALNNAIIAGDGEIVFNFGQAGDIPLGGDWDGKPTRP